jgi:hypothetical protein
VRGVRSLADGGNWLRGSDVVARLPLQTKKAGNLRKTNCLHVGPFQLCFLAGRRERGGLAAIDRLGRYSKRQVVWTMGLLRVLVLIIVVWLATELILYYSKKK